jgi:hypothetical protein
VRLDPSKIVWKDELERLTTCSPAVLFDKNVQDPARLNTIKSLDAFYDDMEANTMPQYIYITPNMCKLLN